MLKKHLLNEWAETQMNKILNKVLSIFVRYPQTSLDTEMTHVKHCDYYLKITQLLATVWKSLSRVQLPETPGNIQSMEFSKPEY